MYRSPLVSIVWHMYCMAVYILHCILHYEFMVLPIMSILCLVSGDMVTANIMLQKSIPVEAGQSFIVRENDLYVMNGKVSQVHPLSNRQVKNFNVAGNQSVKVEKKRNDKKKELPVKKKK